MDRASTVVDCYMHANRKRKICSLLAFLKSLVDKARNNFGLTHSDPTWCLDDQSFEKMGALMSENHSKLLGLYDELAMFLSQINVFRGHGVSD